ncbi:MAG: POTRA domain-containing protein [Flavobacteriales bacterium]
MIIIIFLCKGVDSYSQDLGKPWQVVWSHNNQSTLTFSSKAAADSAIYSILQTKIMEGYFEAKVDTQITQQTIQANIVSGTLYQLNSINVYNTSNDISEENKLRKIPFQISILQKNINSYISEYENSGYPFVSFTLDSLKQKDTAFDSYWSMATGPFIKIDSIVFISEQQLPERYLKNYLGLRKGDAYNESLIQKISSRIQEIPFVDKNGNIEIVFRKEGARIYIPLKKKKANYFNAVVGIRPNDLTGKVNITGDVEIKLKNVLNRGEDIFLNWKRLQAETQSLDLKASIPYIFNTPIGIEGDLSIYRRDSTFSTNAVDAGLFVFPTSKSKVTAYIENKSTSNLGALSALNAALGIGVSRSTFYGLKWNSASFDYLYNPRKGASFTIDGTTGTRSFQIDPEADFQNKKIFRLATDAQVFIPTFKKQAVRIGAQSAVIDASGLFLNELYRIGGLRTIRGIDEESIFAQKWAMTSIEYRFLPEKNTAIYAFFDQAWYSAYVPTYNYDNPSAFGVGLNFNTKNGIFTFNYALGQQFDNPILIRNAKISFGFQNLF